ncbi:MAG: hypothetical protein UR91_C0020G0009 [Candidatus Nomurabacteria bacterium GW2011_GWC2_35_8]|uniref:Uncharacterized protein n=1 Tax=Candidatus Nomurabacteria bacterium GW2011_GWC2_35_8 TaxID=1618752 RepID=A0A0G0D4W3_9BACT|nr:MAG: hypothetical protein UR91_C0020G0009 [Candidatus Nomurabacteria bacterium GW2011_GWC2_35_8]
MQTPPLTPPQQGGEKSSPPLEGGVPKRRGGVDKWYCGVL